ncbi:hypothetical protein WA026_000424 [Henosepilachna vigintioctopunctata]|uniref:FUN14 domain-containing protein 1 n=1 Tax=Henosepilachna vigintioctopunctata TaxID=420089 RepID=A0AAW1V829_9CUCU
MSDSDKSLHVNISKVEKIDTKQDAEKKLFTDAQSHTTAYTAFPNQEQDIQEKVREVKPENYFDFPVSNYTGSQTKRAENLSMTEPQSIDVNDKIKDPKTEIFDLTEAKAALNRLGNSLRVSTFPRQLGLGTTTGILTGFLSMKIGRLSALAVGGGILLYEVAHHNKIVTKDLETVTKEIKQKNYLNSPRAKKALSMFNHAKVFAGRNKIFSVGFLGGFLLGTGINQ